MFEHRRFIVSVRCALAAKTPFSCHPQKHLLWGDAMSDWCHLLPDLSPFMTLNGIFYQNSTFEVCEHVNLTPS